jgi:hypothetical protein
MMSMSGKSGESMATDKPQVTVYTPPGVMQALDRLCKIDRRSRSLMAAILIEEALIARGYSVLEEQDEPTGQDSQE